MTDLQILYQFLSILYPKHYKNIKNSLHFFVEYGKIMTWKTEPEKIGKGEWIEYEEQKVF